MVINGEPWICHFECITIVIYLILQIMAVSCKEVSHTLELHILTLARSIICNHLLQVRHHVNRELAGTIEAETSHLVADHAVAEALYQALLVCLQISILWSWHVRSNVFIHKGTYKLSDSRIVHSCIHLTVTAQERRIREQCMRSIQERKLHILEGSHIVGHLSTHGFPSRATGSKVILYYPLDEVLAINRSLIAGSILSIQSLDVGRTGSRSNTVNHGVREGNILLHPGSKFLVLSPDESHECLAGCIAIVLQIIAGKDGERAIACSLAATQSLGNISKGSNRLGWILDIVSHLRIVEHEFATLTRDVVSALGDSEGDDLNILRRNLVQNLFLLLNAPIEFNERTQLINLDAVVASTYGKGVFAVLLLQGVVEALITWENHCSTDTPVLLGIVLEEHIGHKLQVSTMEVTYSEVQDTCLYQTAVISITFHYLSCICCVCIY